MIVNADPAAAFGVKVVGGRTADDGKLGAFITNVTKGSVADVEGLLLKGRLCLYIEMRKEAFGKVFV